MSEMKTLTLNGKTYDSFVDKEAREAIENLEQNGITGDQIAEAVEDYFTENPIEIPEGGTAVQADWNAKEGKPGHVLNRTHYTEHKKEYIAENVAFTKTANMQSFDWITYLKVENLKEVYVIFDGVEYVCPVKVVIDIHDGIDESYFSIGSTFGSNVNPDYPFGFFGYKGNAFSLVYADEGEHTISVYYDGEEIVHKLDPKYLPEVVTDEQIASAVEDYMAKHPVSGGGLTAEQITALDNMFKVCAFTKEDVSAEYNAFCTAFGIEGGIVPDEPDIPDEPTVTLSRISVTYSGGDVAVGTAVNDLTGIVVTAHYSDGTSKAVTGYTLSGTIGEGSNTITVSYGGKTATFTVTGVAESGGGDEPGELVDTTAKIAAYDKGYYWGSQIEPSNYTGACVTEIYPYTNDIDKLKAHSSYDAENDCMTGTTMFPGVVYYIPNAKFTEAGNSVQSTKTKFALSRDGAFYSVGSITANTEKTTNFSGKTNNEMYGNGVAFTLFTADVDDSYAYWSVKSSQIAPVGVRHGDIIFAGKNTPYYGMANIDGTMAVTV